MSCQYNVQSPVSMVEGGVSYSFGCDRRGNLTREYREEELIRQYTYDSAGRMSLEKNLESGTDKELMVYETAAGRTFFHSDIYGSPLFAMDGQGQMGQYVERGIWGDLKPGTEIPSDLEENLRFTSYRHDPVIGKYFAQARFYDSTQGRMLGKDLIKRGLNPYPYCDNDPVDYTDPTGGNPEYPGRRGHRRPAGRRVRICGLRHIPGHRRTEV